MKKQYQLKFTMLVCAIGIIITCCAAYSASCTAESGSSTDFNVEVDNVLEMSISGTTDGIVNLDVLPTAEGKLASTSFDVVAWTNNITGYTLTMQNSSSDLTGTHGGTIPTLESDTLKTNFPLNKWGYSLDDITYKPVLNNTATVIRATDTYGSVDTNTINLATKIDTTIPADSYTNSFNFMAVANAMPQPDLAGDFEIGGEPYSTLGEALDAAHDGDQIEFVGYTYQYTMGQIPEYTISKNVTLKPVADIEVPPMNLIIKNQANVRLEALTLLGGDIKIEDGGALRTNAGLNGEQKITNSGVLNLEGFTIRSAGQETIINNESGTMNVTYDLSQWPSSTLLCNNYGTLNLEDLNIHESQEILINNYGSLGISRSSINGVYLGNVSQLIQYGWHINPGSSVMIDGLEF